jgi:methylenetetrahydrofolate reductase (NADPH)
VTLAQRIEAGELVLTSELPSVDGGGTEAVRRGVAAAAPWVDAVNATDNTSAHAHASSLAVAIALRQLGVEPIMQLVCRDRNRLALEADLVGAGLHGVENVLALSGDVVSAGDEPDAHAVFDLDSMQLLRAAAGIAGGRYLSGRRFDDPPRFFLGAVETPGSPTGVERAAAKVEAGARFFQLQICFDPGLLAAFLRDVRGLGAAFLPSVPLVSSARGLRFMDEKVGGIDVPASTIDRVERAADEAEACLDVAVDLAERALELPGVAGLHLITFRGESGIARLCERLGIPARAEREASGHRPPVAV